MLERTDWKGGRCPDRSLNEHVGAMVEAPDWESVTASDACRC
jgi:hypothetical protein